MVVKLGENQWGPLGDRLARYVQRGPGCWEWGGPIIGNGYGQITIGQRRIYAHRFVYERERGQIPAGMELDHRCRNRRCVNPDHLDPVTHRENMLRADAGFNNRAKVACPLGHAYTEANTYIYRGRRNCRTCALQRSRRRRHGTQTQSQSVPVPLSRGLPRPSMSTS